MGVPVLRGLEAVARARPRRRRRRGRRGSRAPCARPRRSPCSTKSAGSMPARRPADAEPDPQVLPAAQRPGDRAQPVVAVVAAAALEPERPVRDVQLVVHDDEPLDGHLVEVAAAPATGPPDSFMYERGSASTTRGAGSGPSRPSTTSRARLVRLGEPAADPLGQQVEDHEADVVPVARYAGPGLPSPTTRKRRRIVTYWRRRPTRQLPRAVGLGVGSAASLGAASVGSSRSMPASASASASSASSCSAVGAARTATTTWSGSPISVVPAGSATVAGGDVVADLEARRWRSRSGPGCGWPRPRR